MRTLFLTAAAFAALMIGAPIGKAHAEYIHGTVNGQPFHGSVYGNTAHVYINNGPQGFGAGLAEGLANVDSGYGYGPAPARHWNDLLGMAHDCSEWHGPFIPFNNCK